MRHAAAVLFASLAAGCAPRTASQPWHRGAPVTVAPIEQVHQGMGHGQVVALLGEPTDKSTVHITGKIWIPFYFGDDAFEESWHYKGQGRVIFSGGLFFPLAVYKVDMDPGESGYYQR